MTTLAFITPDSDDPSARLRIRNHLPLLARRGIESALLEIPRSLRGRMAFFRSLRGFDGVVLHRKLFSFLDFKILRSCSRRLVFDFDDALMCRVPWKGGGESRVRKARFARTAAGADALTPGSRILLDMAGTSGKEAEIIPTAVDLSLFDADYGGPGKGLVLGWIGQKSSLPYVDTIAKAMEKVGCMFPGAELRIIADAVPRMGGINVIHVPWNGGTEAEDLAGIHAGLAPLTDDQWSRGKCGFKILQYFAARRPVVASPVGMNAELVIDGGNGFLARTPEDWVRKISILARDPALRLGMGEAGRRVVEERFSLDVVSRKLAEFLLDVCR